MDPLGLKSSTDELVKAAQALPIEVQSVVLPILDRIGQLEAQAAKDTNAIADKVIAAVVPQIQALTETANAVADQAMSLLRRIDGASVTVKLGDMPA